MSLNSLELLRMTINKPLTISRPISVLHVIDKLSMDGVNPSSCAILLGEWFSHLNREQFYFGVCSLRNPDPSGEYLEKKGVSVHYLDHGKFSVKNITGITNLIKQNKVDIVHLHGYSSANFGRIAARRKGILNIVHEHAVLKVLPHQYMADLLLRRYTDAAVAVSGNVRDFMIKARSIPESKISIIWNGIRNDKFKKSDQTDIKMKRLELGIPEEHHVVGTVTRLRKEKGNEYFIKSASHILREVPNVFFLIVGDGPQRFKLGELAKTQNLSKNMKFLGYRTDIVELLSILDVNVIPSLSEGFPLSLVEAMSVGNAIVATEVGGMKEIAENGKNILFVPPKNPIEIAEKVVFFLRNGSYAAELSEAAKKMSNKLSISENVNLLSQLYLKLLE